MYEVRAHEVCGDLEIRTAEQATAFLDKMRMPSELRSVALARWREARGIAPVVPTTEQLRQRLDEQIELDDAQRRAAVDALGREVRDAAEDDPESQDDMTEDELQNLFQRERYLGSTDDCVYALTPDNDVACYNYSTDQDGVAVDWNSRRVLSQAEISAVRAPWESRYYELCKANDFKRRVKAQ